MPVMRAVFAIGRSVRAWQARWSEPNDHRF
jgi:hypothetical protein